MEQSPVRPASAGGWLGTPSRSRGTAAAVGGSAVSPADMRTVQRPTARAAANSPVAVARGSLRDVRSLSDLNTVLGGAHGALNETCVGRLLEDNAQPETRPAGSLWNAGADEPSSAALRARVRPPPARKVDCRPPHGARKSAAALLDAVDFPGTNSTADFLQS